MGNGTNRKQRRGVTGKAKTRSGCDDAAKAKKNSKLKTEERARAAGKPTVVHPDEAKLVTKSGKVRHSARPSVPDAHGVHVVRGVRRQSLSSVRVVSSAEDSD